MRRLPIISTFLVLFSSSLCAQTLTESMSPSWNGLYLGAQMGPGVFTNDADFTIIDPIPQSEFDGNRGSTLAVAGSAMLGINIQPNDIFVFGAQAEIGLDSARVVSRGVIPFNETVAVSTDFDWHAAVVARAGILLTETMLLYGLGGWTAQQIGVANDTYLGSHSEIAQGVTWGIGFEHKLVDSLTLGLEYRRTEFQTLQFTDRFVELTGGGFRSETRAHMQADQQSVNVVVRYLIPSGM